jgi:hypothetical protein
MKFEDGSESVKVIVEVCPSPNDPTPDLVIATVGDCVSKGMASEVNAMLRFASSSVNVPAAMENTAEPVESAGGVKVAV